jgi:hypothetical protein
LNFLYTPFEERLEHMFGPNVFAYDETVIAPSAADRQTPEHDFDALSKLTNMWSPQHDSLD